MKVLMNFHPRTALRQQVKVNEGRLFSHYLNQQVILQLFLATASSAAMPASSVNNGIRFPRNSRRVSHRETLQVHYIMKREKGTHIWENFHHVRYGSVHNLLLERCQCQVDWRILAKNSLLPYCNSIRNTHSVKSPATRHRQRPKTPLKNTLSNNMQIQNGTDWYSPLRRQSTSMLPQFKMNHKKLVFKPEQPRVLRRLIEI